MLDLTEKGYEVARAPKGQRLRTGFEKGMEFVGEGLGAFFGDILVGAATIETAGLSLVVAPAVTVGAAAVGGYYGEKIAEKLENDYDYLKNKW